MSVQPIFSKQTKTKTLLTDPNLVPNIPVTKPFSYESVKQMLEEYKMIYIKPDRGTYGNGVIRIEYNNVAEKPYFFQYKLRKRFFVKFDTMFTLLLRTKLQKVYLCQQGIELLKHKNRRFDLRLMVQQNPSKIWEITGILGRLADPKRIVTNYHDGAELTAFSTLFSSHLHEEEQDQLEQKINELGLRCAKALQNKFPRIKEFGLDIAVDEQYGLWVLEVNSIPDPYIFLILPDPEIFLKIYNYGVAYGRYRKRKWRQLPKVPAKRKK